MTDIKMKASRVKHLKNDEAFTEVIEEVTKTQISVFLNPGSSEDERKKAHDIVCALQAIEDHIDSILSDEKIFDKRNPS